MFRVIEDQYQLIHNHARRGHQMKLGIHEKGQGWKNQVLNFNFDQHMNTVCDPKFTKLKDDDFHCECHDSYIRLKQTYPEDYSNIPVSSFNNDCDELEHYVPSEAKKGKSSIQESMNLFKIQLKQGTFPKKTKGLNNIHHNHQAFTHTEQLGKPSKTNTSTIFYILIVILALGLVPILIRLHSYFSPSKQSKNK